ncbi:ABC transporter permease [Phytoactinopolyspora limicola]|uniref:ABC transporter permease n=1 Tax=Phytoactinopolyspora limicola TaxID=2715536 RepID=UPI0024845BE8|nr:ABC transporter permease [Phytoactinopolyspora limicola]
MPRYLPRLLVRLVLTVFVVASAVFFGVRMVPGGPATALLGADASPVDIAAVNEKLGLEEPLIVQYGRFLGQLATGSLGNSLVSDRPVTASIMAVLPHTLELAIAGMAIGMVGGVLLGVFTAAYRNRAPDYIGRVLSLTLLSFPSYYIGVLLIFLVALRVGLPTSGAAPLSDPLQNLSQLILPALALGIVGTAYVARVTRGLMLEVLDEDHVRTARAKGISEFRVLIRHALQPASLPIASLGGLFFIVLIGDAVLIETVFARPGLGTLMVDAMLARDYTMVQGAVIVVAAVIVVVNSLLEIVYRLIDPRIRVK